MEVLETPRLVMRQFRETDWDAYAAMSANARSIRVAEAIGEKLAGEVELLGAKALVFEAVRA